ncbi:MAG: alpha/beta fold hydrolase [Anaerolineales bacterium]|nr:alpha/beta fold hydrolase [Anaerolineales bacterium]MCB9127570.1 alpha/beta fold hydrolase [Ardenticatenales bacterium]
MTDPHFSLHHLSLPPRQREEGESPAILLLHGFGANERDLMGLASYFDPRFHILSARAPLTLGPQMFAWYNLTMFADGSFQFDEAQARTSLTLIHEFIDEAIAAYGLDRSRFYLAGFSQGAIQGSALLLIAPEAVGGLVAMSGRWPVTVDDEIAPDARLAGKPVLALHGLYDPVIRISYGHELRDRWQQLPVDFSYHEFPMAHEINMEALNLVRGWLAARLNGNAEQATQNAERRTQNGTATRSN